MPLQISKVNLLVNLLLHGLLEEIVLRVGGEREGSSHCVGRCDATKKLGKGHFHLSSSVLFNMIVPLLALWSFELCLKSRILRGLLSTFHVLSVTDVLEDVRTPLPFVEARVHHSGAITDSLAVILLRFSSFPSNYSRKLSLYLLPLLFNRLHPSGYIPGFLRLRVMVFIVGLSNVFR